MNQTTERWPLPADYSAVLQHPRHAFRGPFLKQCRIDVDAHGLPLFSSWTGGLDVVFRATDPKGKRLAIIAFTQPIADREERYRCVLDHWTCHRRPRSMLPFRYYAAGIRSTDGKLYPMVTHEWPDDESLYRWVRSRCQIRDKEALSRLADRWIETVQDLAAARIAHGNLTHSTIRVTQDEQFRFVGYESMCVPALVGRSALATGQRPYQHPDRNRSTPLSLEMDRFSALFVFTVLTALKVEPELWDRHVEVDGYDKLLIRPEDFKAGAGSQLFADMSNSSDAKVRRLAIALFASYRGPIDNVQPISDCVPETGSSNDPVRSEQATVFISAKSADYGHARKVYHFLRDRGIAAFMSEESLPQLGNSDYREAIDEALDQAQHMIVVTSSAANARAPWVKAEWGLFVNEKRSGRKTGNLVTFVIGDMSPGDLPASLRYYEVISLHDDGSLEKVLPYVRQ